MSIKVRTESAAATRRLAARVEPLLRPGDQIVLSGDLGGGKTTFMQGLAAAMGITEPVTSPTFTLALTYQGRLRLHHLDAYRLTRAEEAIDLNVPELLDDDGVVAIEWGEKVLSELPRDYLVIRFQFGGPDEADDVRMIEIDCVGPTWTPRLDTLAASLDA